jgi:hypothetical protein
VTEARRGHDLFGEERLAVVLSGAVDAAVGRAPGTAPAGSGPALVAEAVADRVLAAVTAFGGERDDVAVLVLAAS